MKILVRLPNWMGDMVMSIGFMQALKEAYPDASISVVVKAGLEDLLEYFPAHGYRYLFAKQEFRGLSGTWRFGRHLAQREKFDLYFSLPDSFSAAWLGFCSAARWRVGYKNEARSWLLTKSIRKDQRLHRTEQYVALLDAVTGKISPRQPVLLRGTKPHPAARIIVNINSEAVSRRLPLAKAVSLLTQLRSACEDDLLLIGGSTDIAFVEEVLSQLPEKKNIRSLAGKTTIPELINLMLTCPVVLTTDSGPAHLANACGIRTVVLFGAGNENNTRPYNEDICQVIRLGELPCEPCVKNTCVLFGVPKCLQLLDEVKIIKAVLGENSAPQG